MKNTKTQLTQIIREMVQKKSIKEASGQTIDVNEIASKKIMDAYTLAEKEIGGKIKGKYVIIEGIVDGKNYKGTGLVLGVDVQHEYEDLTVTIEISTDNKKKVKVEWVTNVTLSDKKFLGKTI